MEPLIAGASREHIKVATNAELVFLLMYRLAAPVEPLNDKAKSSSEG
jgi:hypothetical protein